MNHQQYDLKYMRRCLQLAANGKGKVSPNPLVGCVITKDGNILSEGFHRAFGAPHAEVEAVENLSNISLAKDSTFYVNLEPCVHTGKTPPCADLLIRLKPARVVIGNLDPNPLVAGKGVAKLKAAGIEVTVGVFEEACRELNREFLFFHEKRQPFIHLKWAESADGFLDILRKNADTMPAKITSPETDIFVHQLRAENTAILVGKHTALLDNPKLNVRHITGRQPARIIIDPGLELGKQLHIFDQSVPTVIFNQITAKEEGHTNYVLFEEDQFEEHLFAYCYAKGLSSVLVEGGAYTLQAFIKSGHWNAITRIRSSCMLGTGIPAPVMPEAFKTASWEIGSDRIEQFKNPHL